MRKLRVATLLSFPLGPGSGLGMFIMGLHEALSRAGRVEIILVATDRVRGQARKRFEQALLTIRQYLALQRARPDVVHTHDHPALLAAAVLYRMVSAHEVRIIYTLHLDPPGRRSAWKRHLLGWLLRRCEAVTTVSRDTLPKLELIAMPVPRDILHVVPGAASVVVREKTDPAVVEFARSIGHRGGPVLLQVSNFVHPSKVAGTERLLHAMAIVRRQRADARLLLLGTGPLVDGIKALRDRLGLEDAVFIPGTFIDDLSLPMGLADLHCHISLQDACPISILEAMHAGKPIVASRTGGIPEIIDDGVSGLLVGEDPAEIAATILGLLENAAQAESLGVRARKAAMARFTWDRVAADFERLYRSQPSAGPALAANGSYAAQ